MRCNVQPPGDVVRLPPTDMPPTNARARWHAPVRVGPAVFAGVVGQVASLGRTAPAPAIPPPAVLPAMAAVATDEPGRLRRQSLSPAEKQALWQTGSPRRGSLVVETRPQPVRRGSFVDDLDALHASSVPLQATAAASSPFSSGEITSASRSRRGSLVVEAGVMPFPPRLSPAPSKPPAENNSRTLSSGPAVSSVSSEPPPLLLRNAPPKPPAAAVAAVRPKRMPTTGGSSSGRSR
jgi:hypothetical protein